MKSNTLRKYIDLLLFFTACFLTGTGLLIHYRLLPGYRGGHGLTLLGLSRHQWGEYHLWASYALIALTLIHLTVNYAFIKTVIAARRNWLMILFGLIGLLIVLFFLLAPIEKAATGQGAGQGGQGAGHGAQVNAPAGPEQEHVAPGEGPGKQGQGRGKQWGRNKAAAEPGE
jgi:hypothetical protein